MSEYVVEFVGGPWDGKLHGWPKKQEIPHEFFVPRFEDLTDKMFVSPEQLEAVFPYAQPRTAKYILGRWRSRGRARDQLVFVFEGEH